MAGLRRLSRLTRNYWTCTRPEGQLFGAHSCIADSHFGSIAGIHNKLKADQSD